MTNETLATCSCLRERYQIDLHGPFQSQNAVEIVPLDQNGILRGAPSGFFNDNRPVYCFIHTNWCAHRPTMLSAEVSPRSGQPGDPSVVIDGGIIYGTPVSPSGSARVFVESSADRSKYLFAETQFVANVAFPVLQARYHYEDGTTRLGGPYQPSAGQFFLLTSPVFGVLNNTTIFESRNAQDPDDYTKTAWPLERPSFWITTLGVRSLADLYIKDGAYTGTKQVIRAGYRNNNQDVVVCEVCRPHNVMVPPEDRDASGINPERISFYSGVHLSIGCSWADIIDPRQDGQVRCGVESQGGSLFQNPIAPYGLFTIPFFVPRSFFVEPDGSLERPPSAYQYVGAECSEDQVTTAIGIANLINPSPVFAVAGPSTGIDFGRTFSTVATGGRRANVWVEPADQEDSETIPATLVKGSEQVINDSSPFFSRRLDLIADGRFSAPGGDSWHATHLVKYGSPLSGRNALHNLNVEIVEASTGAIAETIPQSIPAKIVMLEGTNFVTRSFVGNIWQFSSTPATSPRFSIQFLQDGFPTDTLPPLWAWNAMAGQHALSPLAPDGMRLFPNSYQKHYAEALREISYPIVEPTFSQIGGNDPIGPFTAEQFAEFESVQCPENVAHHRVDWSLQTFPQLWATTSLNGSLVFPGEYQASLESSGMSTNDYDTALLQTRSLVDYGLLSLRGATISCSARIGFRYRINRVRGYRRTRVPHPSLANYWSSTETVAVYGDHECNDVACDEMVFDWEVSLTGEQVQAISDGGTVEKHIQAGSLVRTMRFSVSEVA